MRARSLSCNLVFIHSKDSEEENHFLKNGARWRLLLKVGIFLIESGKTSLKRHKIVQVFCPACADFFVELEQMCGLKKRSKRLNTPLATDMLKNKLIINPLI